VKVKTDQVGSVALNFSLSQDMSCHVRSGEPRSDHDKVCTGHLT